VKTVVGVAQLVELWIVIPAVVGSNPIVHPTFFTKFDVVYLMNNIVLEEPLTGSRYAGVVELVDTLDLDSSASRRESSSLSFRTILCTRYIERVKCR
jgi:hypothetical protein